MRKLIQVSISMLLGFLVTTAPAVAQKHDHAAKEKKKERVAEKASDLPEAIWEDRGDVSALNLYFGEGGKADAPKSGSTYVFVKEDLEGTSPKFEVEDETGVRWRVKLGEEPQSETAATRLLWAAGYFVDEDYYLDELKVDGLPKLKRGEKFVSAGGTVHHVRLERHLQDDKKLDNWDWFQNSFEGQREFNGLKIMMALVNNWDLKDVNNEIRVREGKREFEVSDLGASLGRTGNTFTRSKSNPNEYFHSPFVAKISDEYVDFVMHSRPFFLAFFDRPNYQMRARMEKVTKHIPRADARWLGQRLSLLSEVQIRDCFSAAGYKPQEIDNYMVAVKKRIGELSAL